MPPCLEDLHGYTVVVVKGGQNRYFIRYIYENRPKCRFQIVVRIEGEKHGSFLEQDSTTVPKSAYLRFCPFGKSCWGVPSPNPAMRHSPLENPTEKYLKNRPQNGGK